MCYPWPQTQSQEWMLIVVVDFLPGPFSQDLCCVVPTWCALCIKLTASGTLLSLQKNPQPMAACLLTLPVLWRGSKWPSSRELSQLPVPVSGQPLFEWARKASPKTKYIRSSSESDCCHYQAAQALSLFPIPSGLLPRQLWRGWEGPRKICSISRAKGCVCRKHIHPSLSWNVLVEWIQNINMLFKIWGNNTKNSASFKLKVLYKCLLWREIYVCACTKLAIQHIHKELANNKFFQLSL